jgi:hypothetical protein
MTTYPHLGDVPVFDSWIRGLVAPLEVDSFDCPWRQLCRSMGGKDKERGNLRD